MCGPKRTQTRAKQPAPSSPAGIRPCLTPGVRTVFGTPRLTGSRIIHFFSSSWVAPKWQVYYKSAPFSKRVWRCPASLEGNNLTQDFGLKRRAFAHRQADLHLDMLLPGSHWLPTCSNSKCLSCIRGLGKTTAMKQLNRLASTAPPAAALPKHIFNVHARRSGPA